MSEGLWVVVEGPDGSGKTSLIDALENRLQKIRPDLEVIKTKHPGSTPLGHELRKLLKNPEQYNIKLDPLSRQMLMFADHINFSRNILIPALQRGAVVLADRCDLISGLVYGPATGLNYMEVNALMQLATRPRIDMMFLLDCSVDLLQSRIAIRQDGKDEFDNASKAFLQLIVNRYRNLHRGEQALLTNRIVALENVFNLLGSSTTQWLAVHAANMIIDRKNAMAA